MQSSTERTIQPKVVHFWLAALVVAWAIDLLFWQQSGGLNFPIWTGLGILMLFLLTFLQKQRPAPASYLLAAATLLASITIYTRNEPLSRFINGVFACFGLGLLTATLTSGNWLNYRIGDYLMAALKVIAAAITRMVSALTPKPANTAAPAAGTTAQPADVVPAAPRSSWFKRWLPVLRGLILALPVVAVLAALLAAADPVFGRLFTDLLNSFDLEHIIEYIFRLIYILGLSYLFTGAFLHAIYPEPVEERPDPSQPWKMRFLGSIEAQVILGCVVALFLVFLAIQFRYLFGGQANINETGFTFAEYARRGFFELVWVAVLSLLLYITLGLVTRRETPGQAGAFSALSIALMALVLAILVSALQRLLLYEAAYGYTRLRIYTHIFIPWLALLLLATILLEILRKPGRLGLCFLLVSFGFCLTFAVLNVDAFIVTLDVQRARQGAELDASHLLSLSDDATPAIIAAYQTAGQPETVRHTLGAVLACKQHDLSVSAPDWRSWTLQQQQSSQLLRGLNLESYYAPDHSSIQLNGTDFSCYQGLGMD